MLTYHVTGNQLHNTQLNEPLSNGATELIDVSGVTQMDFNLQWGDGATVDLAAHSEWVGGFSLSPGDSLTVLGSGSFDNQMSFVNGTAIIGVPVIGTGTFNLDEAHSAGRLEFGSSVSAGQTVIDNGYEGYFDHGVVQVDDPAAYHATTILGFGELILEGLHATRYSFKGDMLTLWNGAKAVDTLAVKVQEEAGSPPQAFTVTDIRGAVMIATMGHMAGALP